MKKKKSKITKKTKKTNKKIALVPVVRTRTPSLKQQYSNHQILFKKVIQNAKQTGSQEAIQKLNEYKEKLSKYVGAYQANPKKTNNLTKAISQGTKFLNALNDKLPKKKTVKTSTPSEKEKTPVHLGNLEEAYTIEIDDAEVKVEIRKEKAGTTYNLEIPKIDIATTMLLNDIRNELISITSISMKELVDPKAFTAIKERFKSEALNLITKKLPNLNKETGKFLVGNLLQEMLGLGKIEFLINDPRLEEIVIISAKEPIRVYSKRYGWLNTNVRIGKEEDIINYSNIIARRVGKQITVLNPLLDAHLITGDRINAVLYPINTKGNTITIRKFSRDPYTIVDLIKNKTCDIDIAAIIWLAIEYEMNIIISGGTASGKTVFLNACMPFIPPDHRIISIEDTRELMLPKFLYWTPLVTRTPNPESKGGVSMLDLLINSLRMRPDRIILGEMRKHEEAMVLFEAMHTGHSVYATLHADSAAETVSRLINPPLSIPANLLKAINLNIVMFRDRKKGIRRIAHMAEVEAAGETAKANILYRWIPEQDKIVKHSESSRFFEDISRNTGMSESEINKDIEEKKSILSWLIKNNLRGLEDFGKIINSYYKNKDFLIETIRRDAPSAILKDGK